MRTSKKKADPELLTILAKQFDGGDFYSLDKDVQSSSTGQSLRKQPRTFIVIILFITAAFVFSRQRAAHAHGEAATLHVRYLHAHMHAKNTAIQHCNLQRCLLNSFSPYFKKGPIETESQITSHFLHQCRILGEVKVPYIVPLVLHDEPFGITQLASFSSQLAKH